MRRKYSKEQKQQIVHDLEQSGLSRAAYCRREGLCYQGVSKWINRISKESTSLALVEVKSETVCIGSAIRVRIGESVKVDFPEMISMDQLALFCREAAKC